MGAGSAGGTTTGGTTTTGGVIEDDTMTGEAGEGDVAIGATQL